MKSGSSIQSRDLRAGQVSSPVAGLAVLLAGILITLIDQFYLGSLPEWNDTWHWIQHGILSVGGMGIGAGVVLLHAAGQRRG